MSLCNNCHARKLLETHNSDYNRLLLVEMQNMIAQLHEHGKNHDQAVKEIEVLSANLQTIYDQAVAEIKALRGEAQKMGNTSKHNIDSLQAQIKKLQEHEKELEARQQQLSEMQPERKTKLGHDITRRTAEYLEISDLAALAEASKDGQSAVTSLRTSLGPSQPYLQKCAAPCVFGVVPSESSRFTEGCEHLWKNILGLFSAVIVMANNFNNCETQFNVISMVTFDIKDHTDIPMTIFKSFEIGWFIWDHQRTKKFTVESIQHVGPRVYLDEEGCVNAIEKKWAGRLPPTADMVKPKSYSEKQFWAPVIEFSWLYPPEDSLKMHMDTQMETALKSAGTLAQWYSFITHHMDHDGVHHSSRYALFHHGIMHKKDHLLNHQKKG